MHKRITLWIPEYVSCKCDKDCEIGEYMNDCTCRKRLVDALVVTSDEILDMPEIKLINSNNNKTNYWHKQINNGHKNDGQKKVIDTNIWH